MRIDILTLFPRLFSGPLDESLIGRAIERGLLNVQVRDIREHATGKHHQADDSPYGGGAGMVMMAEPIAKAIENAKRGIGEKGLGTRVIFMCPAGEPLTQGKAIELSKLDNLIIVCGHYEGIDERARKYFDEEISIGDYVLTGGELPALVLIDAVARHIPGVVKEEESVKRDSFYDGLLDHPSYTRPEEFEGERVPEVLLSGDHKKIDMWRRKQQLKRTFFRRPDLLSAKDLSDSDREMLKEIISEA
jgi:tRNA (guanine37-N1)-methyltransferase